MKVCISNKVMATIYSYPKPKRKVALPSGRIEICCTICKKDYLT